MFIIRTCIDRPNLHLILECFTHTFQTVGHLLFVVEMVFEFESQPLKSSFSGDTNSNSHKSALLHFVGQDCIWPKGYLCITSRSGTDRAKIMKRRGIQRMMTGYDVSNVCSHLEKTENNSIKKVMTSVPGSTTDYLYASSPF